MVADCGWTLKTTCFSSLDSMSSLWMVQNTFLFIKISIKLPVVESVKNWKEPVPYVLTITWNSNIQSRYYLDWDKPFCDYFWFPKRVPYGDWFHFRHIWLPSSFSRILCKSCNSNCWLKSFLGIWNQLWWVYLPSLLFWTNLSINNVDLCGFELEKAACKVSHNNFQSDLCSFC